MFRVLFYCEDKDLGRCKIALAVNGGKGVRDTPVVNAEFDDHGEVRARRQGQSKSELVYNALLQYPAKRVTLDDVVKEAMEVGSPNRSAGAQVAHQLKQRELLKHVGPSLYEVRGWKPKEQAAKSKSKSKSKSAKKSSAEHVNGSAAS